MIDFGKLALGPCIAAFGVPFVYCPGAGLPVATAADGFSPLLGIFNQFSSEEQLDTATGLTVNTTVPILTYSRGDIPGAPPCAGEGIEVAGIAWAIVDTTPDGEGGLTLRLMRANA